MTTPADAVTFPRALKWGDRSETTIQGGIIQHGSRQTPDFQPQFTKKRTAKMKDTGRSVHLRYMPALDGLRALAVLAVLAYHADLWWARAGFLGVDVFFVISGYLITTLLLSEFRRTGEIDLLRFWGRRLRRLLPALLLLLAVVSVLAPMLAPDQNSRLGGDVAAALTYVSNWRLVFQRQSYFEAMGRPPLLLHLWSLAVEEQFYLIWPPVLAFALSRYHGGNPRRLVKWILLAVASSAAAAAVIYSPGADPSRIYYGTDTRVGTILIGAGLAFVWNPGKRTARIRVAGMLRDVAGLGALIALGWIVFKWTEFDPQLYTWGLILVAVLSAVAVAAAAHPGLATRTLLANGPMRWLGQRSYSIYLWHWPVYMVTRPQIDIALTGLPLLAIRFGLSLLLAALSYRFVEMPMRRGALGRAWQEFKSGYASRKLRPAATALAVLTVPAILGVGIASGMALPKTSPPAPALQALQAAAPEAAPAAVNGSGSRLIQQVSVSDPAFASAGQAPPAGPAPPPAPPNPPAGPPAGPGRPQVTALGDSVMLIAKEALARSLGNAVVDASVGRQAEAMIDTAQALKDSGQLGDKVIVQVGTNGPVTFRQLDRLMQILSGVPKIYLVNVKVGRPWEAVNNKLMADNVGRWPNASLLDWKGLATGNPQAFYTDGVHLRPNGVKLYVEFLRSRVLG